MTQDEQKSETHETTDDATRSPASISAPGCPTPKRPPERPSSAAPGQDRDAGAGDNPGRLPVHPTDLRKAGPLVPPEEADSAKPDDDADNGGPLRLKTTDE